jgi:hydroxyacylglutathione hydrolase
MKRALLVLGGLIVLVALVFGGFIAVAFMGRKPVVDGFEVGGIRIVADGIVTVGVVPLGPGQVALIDGGNDAEGTAILAELARRQVGPDGVRAIFLTHGHQDHVAAARLFPRAEVMALEREVALIEGRERATGPLLRLMTTTPTGIPVTRALADGETVTFGDTSVRVFAIPGHTPGSAAYLVNGVLFVGDSADATSDGGMQGAAWLFSDSQATNLASLLSLERRLTEERATVTAIAPAHSGVLTDGLTQLAMLTGR